jgi:hypothetical protein
MYYYMFLEEVYDKRAYKNTIFISMNV